MVNKLRCPYQGRGNRNCSHKGCPKVCIYIQNLEKCDKYIEWSELTKDDSYTVETYEELNLQRSDND